MGDPVSYPKGLFYALTVLLVFTTAMVTLALFLSGEIGVEWILLLAGLLAMETVVSGLSPIWGGISSEGGHLRVRLGLLLRVDIPLEKLESAEMFVGKMPIYLRYGVHFAPRKTIAAITSRKSIVAIQTKGPVRAYMHGFPVKVQTFYISVDDPEAVLEMVRPVLGEK